jgi:hypothetical protein
VGRVCWCSRLASADVHFRVICLRPKGNNYTEEAAGARHAHMTVPSHSKAQTTRAITTSNQDYVRHRRFLARLACLCARDFAGAQPRAGQKKCERGRESAAPGKLVSSRGRYRRRLRRVFGREEEARAKSKAGGFFDSFCRLHPADVTDRGATASAAGGRGQMTWFASEEKGVVESCQRNSAQKAASG